jgi:hypothetical protein
MNIANAGGTRLATLEELIDADALRSVIAAGLAVQPMDHQSVRRGIWAYVCNARDVGVPAGQVILSLTAIVEASNIAPRSVRDGIMRRVILWCVDAYFGHIGERVGDAAENHVDTSADSQALLPPVRASNR